MKNLTSMPPHVYFCRYSQLATNFLLKKIRMNKFMHFPQKLTCCTNAVQFVSSGRLFLCTAEIASACQSVQPWFSSIEDQFLCLEIKFTVVQKDIP